MPLSDLALLAAATAMAMDDEPIEEELSDEEGSDDSWESDLESEAEIAEIMQMDIAEDTSSTGKKEYLGKCVPRPRPPATAALATGPRRLRARQRAPRRRRAAPLVESGLHPA